MQASWTRGLGLAGVAGVLALGVFAADAAGEAQVTLNSGTLTVAVPSGADGDHKVFVEPFKEAGGRDGWRVGQTLPFGAAITTSDNDCFGNSFFNDVVCTGQRSALAITMRDGFDTVEVRARQHDGFGDCINGAEFANVATVFLGRGPDELRAGDPPCAVGMVPEFGFPFRFVANGAAGFDLISGTGGPDTLIGGPDGDTLQGGGGDDSLFGSSGSDVINGGAGRDRLEGEGERDTLNSRDGERDQEVDCGPNDSGTPDVAFVDTGDVGGPAPGFLLGPVSVVRNCESVFARPIDDGPPGALLGRRLRIREDGLTRVRIACRRASLVRCRGRVSVSDPRRRARALASASYAIRLGARKRVALRLTSAERALLRRRGRAIVTTREQGRSRRGPRGVLRTLGIAGS